MNAAPTTAVSLKTRMERWWMVISCVVGIAAFLLAHQPQLDDYTATALNDGAWWLGCFVAFLACLRVAQQLKQRERRTWLALTLACGCWLIGQAVWSCYELLLGGLPSFPHWMQGFFSLYDWLFVLGLLLLPKPHEVTGFTPRHGGNLALIVCTLLVALIITLLEPASLPRRGSASNIVIAVHCIGLAAMFITALYLLWSYRWQRNYWPLVWIVIGTGIHTATYIAYVHKLLTVSYLANDWSNVSWIFIFGAYSCAAYERAWQEKYPTPDNPLLWQHRERWLEALVPALLIVVMLAVAWTYRTWLTPRAVGWSVAVAVIFAIALGLREMWIQKEEQRLLTTLSQVNEGMLSANRELSRSESRYRTLNQQLETRVTERTKELQQAYRELENFSYAVAHDLKAPLRSIDGFGSMLAENYNDKLDDEGRRYLDRMRRSALRMSELIDDLLAYARVDQRELRFTAVPIAAIIDKVIAEQHDEIERCGVKVSVNAAPLALLADEEGLLIACRNLLQNAIKFSRQATSPHVSIDVAEQDNGICIAVRDNGIGFDMSHHEKIFEMFQRLHRAEDIPGTGIGLAIVRKAVERMGGRVWAQSAPQAGATFYLHFPVNSAT